MALGDQMGPPFHEDKIMPLNRPFDMDTLAALLGHRFADSSLLQNALIHPSLSGSKGHKRSETSPYERLEFLGDRVLGLVIAHWLYQLYPDEDEGSLAKRHASLVNRDALKKVAEQSDLDSHLRLVRGEKAPASRKNLAALSDAMEGILGALYLDGGLAVAERFIKKQWEEDVTALNVPADPKTALQEYAQGKGLPLPVYKVMERSGPAHAPKFKIQVSIAGFEPVIAEGGAKREAEKEAAKGLLEEIHKNER